MVFEECSPLVDGDALLLEAEEEKHQMNIYAGMIAVEGNKSSDHVNIVYPDTPTESANFLIKTNASDDSTAAATDPSMNSSLNDGIGDDTKPLFGFEGVDSFEDAVVATDGACPEAGAAAVSEVEVICENLEQEDERSAARFNDNVQVTNKKMKRSASDRISELDAVRKDPDDVAESAAPARAQEGEAKNTVEGDTELDNMTDEELEMTASVGAKNSAEKKHDTVAKGVKDTNTVPIQMDDSEQLSAVSLVAEPRQFQKDTEKLQSQKDAEKSESVGTGEATKVSRERKTTFSAPAALPHADVSYIPWLGIQLTEYDSMPRICEDEVLVKVEATTISTRDCLERLRRDNDEDLCSESWVPGHEIVGRVVRVGRESRFLKNRRVAALLPAGGGCSRYVRCHIGNLIAVPERAPSQDIVYLLSTYLTAYQCLEQSVEVDQTSCHDPFKMTECLQVVDEEGESLNTGRRSPLFRKSVLIAGAGSPVGLALIDVARHAGANVYALSHSENEQKIKQMGLREGRWYPLFQKDEWEAKWSGKMNLIVDAVGDYGNYSSFYEVMRSGGRFVRTNTTSAGENVVPVPMRGGAQHFSLLKHFKGSHINRMAVDYNIFDSFEEDKKLFAEDLTYLFHLLRSGKIKRRVFPHIGFLMVEEEWNKTFEGGKADVIVVSCNGPKMRFIC